MSEVPRRRRRRRDPAGPPRLDLTPGQVTVRVLATLSASMVKSLDEIAAETGLRGRRNRARIRDAIRRIRRKFRIPVTRGYALAIGPHEPHGQDIREWTRRHLRP